MGATSRDTAGRSERSSSPSTAPLVVRDLDASTYLESFLVAAVVAVLGIRLFLDLTGYPQVGGGGLHIAHMLWGGLLMIAALVAVLTFVGRQMKTVAAVAGGLGFGTFIDELGKFITSDYDYFFQPTIGLIYVIFVVLFLVFRQIESHRPPTDQEILVSAIDLLKEAIVVGGRSDDVNRALVLLARSGIRTDTADAVREALQRADPASYARPSLPTRVAAAVRHGYDWLIGRRWFQRAILLVFLFNAGVTFLGAILAITVVAVMDSSGVLAVGGLLFAEAGFIVASLAVPALSLIGVTQFPRSRLEAYRWFKRAVLVSIFLVQVFLFFRNELAALGGLAFDLVLLSGLNAMLRAEHGLEEAELIGRSTQARDQPAGSLRRAG